MMSKPDAVLDPPAHLLKTLAHPARLAILELLRDGEHCVCHLEAHLGYRQAYTSQHLKALREAGVIADRRQGWNMYYRVIRPEVFNVVDACFRLTGPRRRNRIRPVSCPCPKCSVSEA